MLQKGELQSCNEIAVMYSIYFDKIGDRIHS